VLYIPYNNTVCEDKINIEDVSGSVSDIDIAYRNIPQWKVLDLFYTTEMDDKGLRRLKDIVNDEKYSVFINIVDYIFYISTSICLLVFIFRKRL
jgi:hypothetical protein